MQGIAHGPPPLPRCRIRHIVCAGLCGSFVSTLLLLFYASELLPDVARHHVSHTRVSKRIRSAVRRTLDVINVTKTSLACRDAENACGGWADAGECQRNPNFMNVSCKRSCGICSSILGGGAFGISGGGAAASGQRKSCDDKSSFCGQWAAVGECDSNPTYMRSQCPVTCHLCQSAACHDIDEASCATQARRGLCRSEPERMYDQCRWSCKWCAMEKGSRCLRAAGTLPAARKGSLAHMFNRAVSSSEMARYTPVVLSRDPWVVTFETFLSAEESDAIIRIGGRGWQRSQAGDGVQSVRTSSTAW